MNPIKRLARAASIEAAVIIPNAAAYYSVDTNLHGPFEYITPIVAYLIGHKAGLSLYKEERGDPSADLTAHSFGLGFGFVNVLSNIALKNIGIENLEHIAKSGEQLYINIAAQTPQLYETISHLIEKI